MVDIKPGLDHLASRLRKSYNMSLIPDSEKAKWKKSTLPQIFRKKKALEKRPCAHIEIENFIVNLRADIGKIFDGESVNAGKTKCGLKTPTENLTKN